MSSLKVLELYSGVGGMHFALKESGVDGQVLEAADINPVANKVYKNNFPFTKIQHRNILSLTPDHLEKAQINMILMSPPCQPYTRLGKQEDTSDRRSDSLSHLVRILPQSSSTLRFILLENVKGFEKSESRNNLLNALQNDFFTREFLLNPLEFGVANSRDRYYLLARRTPFSTPQPDSKLLTDASILCLPEDCPALKDILEFDDDSEMYDQYLVPVEVLIKRILVMDIVTKESKRSCCFTKAYGRYIEGTGSIYCPFTQAHIKLMIEKFQNSESEAEQKTHLKSLRLRFFSPKEVARLMCFPPEFSFPQDISNRQKYNLLGNSLNVKVVSKLIAFLVNPNS